MEFFYNSLNFIRDFNYISTMIRLLLSVILGGVIGMERSRHGRSAGFRTHILVCMGSALTVLCGIYAVEIAHLDTDPLRIGAQVISGIGFLGAGTILVRSQSVVTGLTTAAGLWSTSAIGLACGVGYCGGAVLCTVISLLVMSVLTKLEKSKRVSNDFPVYAELSDPSKLNAFFRELEKRNMEFSSPEVIPPVSSINGHVGVVGFLDAKYANDVNSTLDAICTIDGVSFAVEKDTAVSK